MRTTFVIPHRMEGHWLPWTIQNIERVAPAAEIITMEDNPPIGLSYQRHMGILAAKSEIVMCVDAHMDFQPGLVEAVTAHLADFPRDVLCFECPGIEPDTLTRNTHRRFGADLHLVKNSTDPTKRNLPLASSWREDPSHSTPGECGNVLGGAYAFKRDWYIEGLGGIWQWHRGWGKSEQMLSILNYLVGGRNYCLSTHWAAHYFKNHHETHRPFSVDLRQTKQNAMLIVWSMLDERTRADFFKILGMKPSKTYGRRVLDGMRAIESVQNHLRAYQTRQFSEYRSRFLILPPGY